jgi:hypothetical protein
VHRHRLVSPAHDDLLATAGLGRGLRRHRVDGIDQPLQPAGVRRAHVGEQLGAARDGVGRAGLDGDAADRGHRLRQRPGGIVDALDEAGGGRDRVGSHRHRHRAGVTAAAVERDLDPGHAGDRRNQPQRRPGGRQHRALLDVSLDVRRRRLQPTLAGKHTQPQTGERVGQRDTIGVDQIALIGLEHAGHRPAAEHAAAEAAPFLEPERDHLQPAPCSPAGRNRLHRLQRRDHSQRSVEAAAVGRRVEMRAGHHGGERGIRSGHPSQQVPGRVDGDVEARRLHPAGDQVERPLLALSQSRPVGARRTADLEQAIEPLAYTSRSVHLRWHGREGSRWRCKRGEGLRWCEAPVNVVLGPAGRPRRPSRVALCGSR